LPALDHAAKAKLRPSRNRCTSTAVLPATKGQGQVRDEGCRHVGSTAANAVHKGAPHRYSMQQRGAHGYHCKKRHASWPFGGVSTFRTSSFQHPNNSHQHQPKALCTSEMLHRGVRCNCQVCVARLRNMHRHARQTVLYPSSTITAAVAATSTQNR
jgi:hypothetical protein